MQVNKLSILHIGIKNYPFNSKQSGKSLKGLRGGGMNKYCNTLFDAFPGIITNVVITQRLDGEKEFEIINNSYIYRIKTFGNRAIRQVYLNLISTIFIPAIIKKHRIKIIHGHMQIGILIGYLVAKLYKIKCVGTPYSFVTDSNHFSFGKVAMKIEEVCYNRLDKIIFETKENLNKAKKIRNITLPNAVVINTGIEIPKTAFLTPSKGGKIRIFYIGRIVKIKALDHLINAIALLDENLRKLVKVDIVGEGEMMDYCKNLIENHNLSKNIVLHGFVDNTKKFYEECDLFILPSHMEGLSLSLLEAMAYGKACVINDFGIPFNSEELYTMSNNEPESIVKAIQFFLDNKNLIQDYGIRARSRVQKDFSIKAFSQNHVRLYDNLFSTDFLAFKE